MGLEPDGAGFTVFQEAAVVEVAERSALREREQSRPDSAHRCPVCLYHLVQLDQGPDLRPLSLRELRPDLRPHRAA